MMTGPGKELPMAATPAPQQSRSPLAFVAGGSRIFAPDALRGLIILTMALDHANYFVAQRHSSGEYWGGPFPVYQDALSFLTRFVTHLAAPGFFFLMGAGMFLFARSRSQQGWQRGQVRRHFMIRGGLLIVLQLLIVNRAWELSPGGWYVETYIGVLFALGGTMILGSFLLDLPPNILVGLSLVLLVGTELLAPDPALWQQLEIVHPLDYLNLILIRPGGTQLLWSNYPILPWMELVVLGIAFGHWMSDTSRAYRRSIRLGLMLLILFLVIRYLDGFGNIRPREGDSWIDFLNVVKYPPSIAFTCLAMGINLTLLGLFGRARPLLQRWLSPLATLGRTPLFFYISHLFLYAALGALLAPNGTTIPGMLPLWLLGVALLYPLCLWYGQLRRRQPAGSLLRYL